MAIESVTYIYGLADPRDGRIRYIGKANDVAKRVRQHLRETRRRYPLYRWIAELRTLGLVPTASVLATVPADAWQNTERSLIATYPDLLNLAEGGDEPHCSIEVRAANGRKNAHARNRRLWYIKLQIGIALKAGRVRESTRAKLREVARKRPDLFGEWANL